MSGGLISKLKMAAISSAVILGVGLYSSSVNAKEEVSSYLSKTDVKKSGPSFGFGQFSNIANGVTTNVYKVGSNLFNDEILVSWDIVRVEHTADTVFDSKGNETGVELRFGKFLLDRDYGFTPYGEFNFGISKMSRSIIEGYDSFNLDTWNKTLGASAGFSLKEGKIVLTLAYNFRHVSDLSTSSLKDGLETSGLFLSIHKNF